MKCFRLFRGYFFKIECFISYLTLLNVIESNYVRIVVVYIINFTRSFIKACSFYFIYICSTYIEKELRIEFSKRVTYVRNRLKLNK